jgi:hypothetical protein
VQGFSPLKTSIAFVLIQGFTLVLLPLISRLMHRVNPRWMLGGGFVLIAAGDFWAATVPISRLSITPMIAPLALVGIGFAFAVSSVTAVAANTVRIQLAGMASAALSRAASTVQAKIAGSPTLQHTLNRFYGSVASAPAAQRQKLGAAVAAVKSGPLGANAVPATAKLPNGHTTPLNPLKGVAFHALGNASPETQPAS